MNPYYQQDGQTIYLGDCRDVLPTLGGVTAVVTDPPYGLEFMGKDWDHGIPGQHFWELILSACLPGAMCLAFGGTRTYHRLVCAIEDAGFEIRDCIQWIYGSGFPKSLDISKAIDKAAGETGERGPMKRGGERLARLEDGKRDGEGRWGDESGRNAYTTIPSTEHAKTWNGYGTALKPAHEPICVAMKPLAGTYAENAIEHGVAGINVDGCRVGTDGGTTRSEQAEYPRNSDGTEDRSENWARTGHGIEPTNSGRWPANIIHDGSDEVVRLFPETGNNGRENGSTVAGKDGHGSPFNANNSRGPIPYFDSGSAARFFKECKQDDIRLKCRRCGRTETVPFDAGDKCSCGGYFDEVLDNSELLICRANTILSAWNPSLANTVDDHSNLTSETVVSVLNGVAISASHGAKRLSDVSGLTTNATPKQLKQLAIMLITAILSIEKNALPGLPRERHFLNGCRVAFAEATKASDTMRIMISLSTSFGFVDPATLSITSMNSDHGAKASNANRFHYCAKESDREIQPQEDFPLWGESYEAVRNNHPTVKPLALMSYLIKLVTMPERNLILDPFAGSGSTLVACRLAGIPAIGIEQNEQYAEIAANRLRQGVLNFDA